MIWYGTRSPLELHTWYMRAAAFFEKPTHLKNGFCRCKLSTASHRLLVEFQEDAAVEDLERVRYGIHVQHHNLQVSVDTVATHREHQRH
jgi:hypothetical protein